MKIYTKTGDTGETGLFGGRRVSKGSLRVEAYGAVDELNAHLGWAATLLTSPLVDAHGSNLLRQIQSDLFVLGADLATPLKTKSNVAARTQRMTPAQTQQLEAWIDRWEAEMPPLRHFILPGGTPAAAALHVCRAVCRRAERCVVRLAEFEPVNPEAIVYLNRLSDLLFVLARWVNTCEGGEEVLWQATPAR
ncbi:MAG: cob(I)yrinic acid a,c-diamide adenosyltransferase [Abditibacteriales bacterium]|nr:cob(I)yrinic acid a,c-diamide adenosyltransferase [Abditibacteriales bacterium]MDW8368526.1 cob(I)yrinic acid a,c-diamide adenosyltransferase [Abditibacteriales bacterium]